MKPEEITSLLSVLDFVRNTPPTELFDTLCKWMLLSTIKTCDCGKDFKTWKEIREGVSDLQSLLNRNQGKCTVCQVDERQSARLGSDPSPCRHTAWPHTGMHVCIYTYAHTSTIHMHQYNQHTCSRTHRHADTQIDIQTDVQRYRHRDRQTDIHADSLTD